MEHNINRSAVRGLKRPSYETNPMMSVKFSDDMGKNEEGVDLGGPMREFLRLPMKSIAKSPMFKGKEYSQNFTLSSTNTDLSLSHSYLFIFFGLIYNLNFIVTLFLALLHYLFCCFAALREK